MFLASLLRKHFYFHQIIFHRRNLKKTLKAMLEVLVFFLQTKFFNQIAL